MTPRNTLLVLAFLVAFTHLAPADTVFLKNGRRLDGILVSENDEKVRIKMAGGIQTIKMTEVERVERHGPDEQQALEVALALRRRDVLTALTGMAVILAREPGKAGELAQLLLDNETKIVLSLTKSSADDKAQLVRRLEGVEALFGLSPESRAMSGRFWQAIGEDARAIRAYVALSDAYFEANPGRRELIVSYLTAQIRHLISVDQYERVIDMIEDLARVAPKKARGSKALASLQWAERARVAGDYETALSVYAGDLMDLLPSIARERMVNALKELRRYPSTDEAFQNAIRLHDVYGRKVAPIEALSAVIDLRLKHGEFLYEAKEYENARVAFDAYYDLLKLEKRPWSRRCDYRLQRRDVPSTDSLGLYTLGEYCVKHTLYDEAEKEFEALSDDPLIGENARLQALLVHETREIYAAERAERVFSEGDYLGAIGHCMYFIREFPDSGLVVKIEQLMESTSVRLSEAAASRGPQADALLQQAERHFFSQEYGEALRLLDSIRDNYADTPAGVGAIKMRRAVLRKARKEADAGNIELDDTIQKYINEAGMAEADLGEEARKLLEEFDTLPQGAQPR